MVQIGKIRAVLEESKMIKVIVRIPNHMMLFVTKEK